MTYSALIFDTCFDQTDSFENLETLMRLFAKDEKCAQIVVSCSGDWMMRLAKHPYAKTMYVPMLEDMYGSLVHGLKAITQDDVLVAGLSHDCKQEQIDRVIEELHFHPSVVFHEDLQGYDTRLLMFCVQKAIDSGLNIHSFTDAVEQLADSPVTYLKQR